jgi:hypothetical protein
VVLLGIAGGVADSAWAYSVLVDVFASSPSGCTDGTSTGYVQQPSAQATASCDSATASAMADLPTGITTVSTTASGPTQTGDPNAAAKAELRDRFLFSVPAPAASAPLLVDVTFTLDGAIPVGAIGQGNTPFLFYTLTFDDPFNLSDPAATFQNDSSIEVPTSGAIEFTATVPVRQPFFTADLVLTLWAPGLKGGAVDYDASVAIDVPPGVTWTSASGVLLSNVPEPGPALTAAVAILALATRNWTRARSC